jgi:hypothetical protein
MRNSGRYRVTAGRRQESRRCRSDAGSNDSWWYRGTDGRREYSILGDTGVQLVEGGTAGSTGCTVGGMEDSSRSRGTAGRRENSRRYRGTAGRREDSRRYRGIGRKEDAGQQAVQGTSDKREDSKAV